jgi:hypothetical protein
MKGTKEDVDAVMMHRTNTIFIVTLTLRKVKVKEMTLCLTRLFSMMLKINRLAKKEEVWPNAPEEYVTYIKMRARMSLE